MLRDNLPRCYRGNTFVRRRDIPSRIVFGEQLQERSAQPGGFAKGRLGIALTPPALGRLA
jgi:hypothetical protein